MPFLDSAVGHVGAFAFRGIQRMLMRRDALAAERLGEKLGRLGYRLDRKHRERTKSNLRLAFPELTEVENEARAKATFEHFGRVMADFLRSPIRTDEEVLNSIEPIDTAHFEDVADEGKGVIVVTAHLGNWERYAHWGKAIGRPLTVVARDANNSALEESVADIRRSAGLTVLSRGNSARGILETLKKGGIIGILPDQNAGDAFIPFFGKPCGTVVGPAVMHLRTGAPLITGYCLRTGPARYKVELFEPRRYERGKDEPEAIMADLAANLESVIRRYPDQYLWLHDRWKSARKKGLM